MVICDPNCYPAILLGACEMTHLILLKGGRERWNCKNYAENLGGGGHRNRFCLSGLPDAKDICTAAVNGVCYPESNTANDPESSHKVTS